MHDDHEDESSPARIRGMFNATLTDEPALADLVPDAVAGARTRARRDRIAYVAAPLAIVGMAAGVYAAVPPSGGGARDGGVSPGTPRTTATTTTAPTAKEAVIPPLSDPFAHPGTVEESCQGNFLDYKNKDIQGAFGQPRPSVEEQRAQCIANLRIMRSLFPGSTVVMNHSLLPFESSAIMKNMDALQAISTAEPGTRLPGIAAETVKALNDPKTPENYIDPKQFLVKTPAGIVQMGFLDVISTDGQRSGTGTCKNGKSGGTTSKPCSDTTLADGTPTDFVSYPGDMIEIVVDNDRYGNQFFFTARPSDREAMGNTFADDGKNKWLDLATGTVHEGNRRYAYSYNKDMLLALTSSQGFMSLYDEATKAATGH
ncbi:MAG: hypothetical protein HOV83_11455 [Catenulispora sp.]|nr:hypothetical protein [Catenulispora sp.]